MWVHVQQCTMNLRHIHWIRHILVLFTFILTYKKHQVEQLYTLCTIIDHPSLPLSSNNCLLIVGVLCLQVIGLRLVVDYKWQNDLLKWTEITLFMKKKIRNSEKSKAWWLSLHMLPLGTSWVLTINWASKILMFGRKQILLEC